ncbi:hypothetical protein [Clostridium akagii]|uniref:hypothetical protein n=1 Tax=Clostridium akagii TaxID=91623 RepID=UPI000479D432|nr:hypothetical protein [Clostridium akagii]
MSAYSKIYMIGKESKDGLEDIYVEILQGEGEKRWYEAKYDEEKLQRLGNIHAVIPENRDDKNAILDICLAFAPKLFENCKSLANVKMNLGNTNTLDFSTGLHVPKEWESLRQEAEGEFNLIHVYEADIKKHRQQ